MQDSLQGGPFHLQPPALKFLDMKKSRCSSPATPTSPPNEQELLENYPRSGSNSPPLYGHATMSAAFKARDRENKEMHTLVRVSNVLSPESKTKLSTKKSEEKSNMKLQKSESSNQRLASIR
jgi:hypothetical protein